MTHVTHSYDSVESWNRNAQHIENSGHRGPELPDWLTCSAERFINHYLPLFETGQLDPNFAQMEETPE